ncbi:Pectinesterase [Bertholletia excelsa]
MTSFAVCFVLLFFSSHYAAGTADPDCAGDPTSTNFIKASCRATSYPALCVDCLSAFAEKIQQSDKQLAHAALAVSLARARSAAAFVSNMTKLSGLKPRERQAVRDCVETVGDSVEQIRRSMRELRRTSRSTDFLWRMSNVQTWVSAALTNQNTCIDGFTGTDGNIKAVIKRRVTRVIQVTSNALALVNRFASRRLP